MSYRRDTRKSVRREAAAWAAGLRKGKKKPIVTMESNVLTEYPPNLAEDRTALPVLLDLPDLFAYTDPQQIDILAQAYGWRVFDRLPNQRLGFGRACLQRIGSESGGLPVTSSVPFGPVSGLKISDVKRKVVCGDLPPWLSLHATVVVVLEPIVSRMCEDRFCVATPATAAPAMQLAAYEIIRKGKRPVILPAVTEEVSEAIETMTLKDSTELKEGEGHVSAESQGRGADPDR